MMNIVQVTPEYWPFVKTGGLADVVDGLSLELSRRGHQVTVILPYYRYHIDTTPHPVQTAVECLGVPMGSTEDWCSVLWAERVSGLNVYFIEHDIYFGRPGIYHEYWAEYPDNAQRFIFFSRAALQLIKALHLEPDIIHCNDWQTGFVPVFLKTHYLHDDTFRNAASIMTIHNMGYQGIFHKSNLYWTQLGWDRFTPIDLEYYDCLNFLKAGLVYADLITTVSKKYGTEIQTPEFGYLLDGLLRERSRDIYGVTNGVDYDDWNPEIDPYIPQKYSAEDLTGKAVCKAALQECFGLPVNPDVPLIGMVSRLVYQKGTDVLMAVMDRLLKLDIQLAVIGTGEPRYERDMNFFSAVYPEKLGVKMIYDNCVAHLVEAGSDMFLMPSRYEPCGLNQIYSLRYGTLPIVRATGGLDDTVENYDPMTGAGWGFKFYDLTPDAIYNTVVWALSVYKEDKAVWRNLMLTAMAGQYAWDRAAATYERIYRLAKEKRFPSIPA
ncbi:MAG: glycogen synthase GlgA [Deltaproteobacteria bacterium]|nr:glycogen synthase GlgA [Deltaproteobacteria bacterium]